MKKVLFFFIFLSFIFAQDETVTEGWKSSGVAGINLSQIALSNWSQGGQNSLAFNITGNFNFTYISNPWKLDNTLKIAIGKTKLGSENFKTTDNEIFQETVLSRDFGWCVNPYVGNSIRTVIANGYSYENNQSTKIAAFFDPGYVTQSFGFTYDKLKGFKTRLGIAFQETFTNKFRNYSDDPETTPEIERFKFETGMESVTEGQVTLDDNLLFDTQLRLFTRFDQIDVWDVRWDNTLTAKVNNYINVNFNVLVIYEKSQSPKTQLKEALQLGITYTLF
ncbi:MAG: DUF3078 domain-containing protein [Ignavibacteria bacterium]|nr:DUF3078 domain-containing protein [Ignavibacteria bacterium]